MSRKEICPQPEKKEASIFDYYSVKNEVIFLRRQIDQGVDIDSLSGYTKNNIYRFLEEFVAKEKNTKINYSLKNGRIHYDGIIDPISDNYQKRAEAAGKNSREEAEYQGFKSIEQTFAKNEANMAFWLSPPSFDVDGFGDYGFLFVFLKNPHGQINEYVIRYENEDRKFTKSFEIYSRYFSIARSKNSQIEFTDEKSFLKDPLFASVKNPLDFIPKGKEISIIESSPLLNKLTEEYSNEVINLAVNNGDIKSAQEILKTIYNLAGDLLSEKTNNENVSWLKINNAQDIPIEDQVRTAYAYYSKKEAKVIGGGSCPASEQDNQHPFSGSPIDKIIKNNQGIVDNKTATNITSNKNSESTLKCECPFCHKQVEAVIKNETITCPECKKSSSYKC